MRRLALRLVVVERHLDRGALERRVREQFGVSGARRGVLAPGPVELLPEVGVEVRIRAGVRRRRGVQPASRRSTGVAAAASRSRGAGIDSGVEDVIACVAPCQAAVVYEGAAVVDGLFLVGAEMLDRAAT